MEPHYVRARSTRKYLDCDLNLSMLYRLYLKWCEERNLPEEHRAKEHVYREVFHEKNLAFHRPRKDQCDKCRVLRDKNNVEELDRHLKEKDMGRAMKAKCEEKSNAEGDKFLCVDFDLQAVLLCPVLPGKQIYYLRKLRSYNLTIFNFAENIGHAYVWPEYEGGRGSTDIASCLFLHLTTQLPDTCQHVTAFCDSCGGQNRNKFMCSMFMRILKEKPQLEKVDIFYFEPGHSQLRSDTMHSAITTRSKYTKISTPDHWIPIITSANTRRPYDVHELRHSHFFDWKKYCTDAGFVNWTKGKGGERVNWMKIRWVRFYQGSKSAFVKDTFDVAAPFVEICLKTEGVATRRSTESEPQLTAAYSHQTPISSSKKMDLLKMCQNGTIAPQYHPFYHSLPSREQSDQLPTPDVAEEEPTID